ncbi:hypothetical protein [Bradyrhizobium ivorense]|nr:hypothetical protein [Bradyrhizobium ivorense]VIO73857.1 hypothetical protein CI41S_39660 [Bradyrhizobium ivorense]
MLIALWWLRFHEACVDAVLTAAMDHYWQLEYERVVAELGL